MKHLPSLLAPALVLAASLAAATGVADGTEVVFAAIQSGDPALLNAVLKETPSLASATNASGMMPLHFAARVGQAGATETLLAAGADPNAALVKSGGTPLHYAANVDAADVAAILLAKGAKTEAKAVNGRTPLHFAAAKGNDAAAAALLGAGADPNAADPQGQTPLHLAAIAGHPSTIRVLLGAGGSGLEELITALQDSLVCLNTEISSLILFVDCSLSSCFNFSAALLKRLLQIFGFDRL